MPSKNTSARKKDHIAIVLRNNVAFKNKSNGLERLDFVHNALPELDFSAVDTSTIFLEKHLSFPLIVSCMTGGYKEAERINKALAEACEAKKVAMCVGSQRQALEDSTYYRSFSIVREVAPSIPIIGNIGGAEVARQFGQTERNGNTDRLKKVMHLIKADALAIHLNPLQELIQLEGNPNFRGVLRGIERLVKALDIPIIIKEVGAGISAEVARRLIRVGIRIIDVAGAGGTSWAGVEILRRKDERIKLGQFWDWGIPTVDALRSVSKLKGELHKELGQRKSGSAFDKRKALKHLILVASGGIEDGVDMAKSIALGADLVSSARPLLQALLNRGKRNLADILDQWEMELRGVMFLVGASNVEALSKVKLIESK